MAGVENVFIQGKPNLQIQQDLKAERGKYCEELVPQKSCIYVLILHVIVNLITGTFTEMVNKNIEATLKLDTIVNYVSKQKISV